jgi:hypothetical protein
MNEEYEKARFAKGEYEEYRDFSKSQFSPVNFHYFTWYGVVVSTKIQISKIQQSLKCDEGRQEF